MGTHGHSEATTSCIDVAENSQTTVEIKIKTLDSQTYTLRVDKSVPIPKLKEQIATVTGVISEQQRLICRGKVLKDDEVLSTYRVEDGHTLHLVVRQPQQSSLSPSTGQVEHEGASSQSDSNHNHGSQGTRTVVFETVNIGQGDHNTQHLSQIISSILNAVITRNTGSQAAGTDVRNLGARATVDIPGVEPDSRQAPDQIQSAVPLASQQPTVIPDSLTTLHQYLGFMRDEFSREGSSVNGGIRNEASTAPVHNIGFLSHHSFSSGGLPSPASLVEILLSTRQLLMEQADGYITQFARCLEDQMHLTEPVMRGVLQSRVLRSGVLLQNLGSLLLELGRTTLTLRLGERPSEAVVNAGPAVFVSASGPNPVMVQPVPFYPGSSFGARVGAPYSGHASQGEQFGPTFVPGNISIRLRAGRTVPVSAHNLTDQDGQQAQEITNVTNSSSASSANHVVSGGTNNSSIAQESGVRVLPIRTVVAVPAGANRPTSNQSGSAVGLIYPVLARVQHVTLGNLDSARGSVGSNIDGRNNEQEHNIEQQHNIISNMQAQNLESAIGDIINEINHNSANVIPLVSGLNPPVNESVIYQGSLRDFLSAGPEGPPSSNSTGNTEVQFGQQDRVSPISQLTSRLDQWLQTIFPGEQVVVGGIGHQELATGSTTDQAVHENSSSEATRASEDGVFFSRLVRNLMPFISQVSSTEDGSVTNQNSSSQVGRQNLNESSSSQSRRDLPESPSPKRARRDSD